MLRVAAAAAAIACVPAFALALSPTIAQRSPSIVVLSSQSIDSCYKKCFLEAKNSKHSKYACRRICNAQPKKKCEDKCWSKLANDPKKRKACLSRCS
ncbi:MAG TPA: hypothetical protein VNR51_12855 [Hyphomicrobium sp.]|nr:hypothetical protein [Hyphomicrobium sp.]